REVPDAILRPSSPDRSTILYATARVRLRAEPSTSAAIVAVLEPGQQVKSTAIQGPWHSVHAGRWTGWVHGDYLAARRPAAPRQQVRTPIAPLVRQAPAQRGTCEPLRSPYIGRCDCPYD